MNLVLIEKGLILEGWSSKIEVIGTPVLFVYLNFGTLREDFKLKDWGDGGADVPDTLIEESLHFFGSLLGCLAGSARNKRL